MTYSLLLASFCAVFTAELIGDKTLYTISLLAMRCRPLPMICGFTLAFMAKMLAAVAIGNVIATLPTALVATISAVTFFTMAMAIWFKKPRTDPLEKPEMMLWSHGFLVAFAAIFFTEWGDIGQITAATLTAASHQPFTIWLGATLAMMTKGALAMTLGVGLKDRIPRQAFRYAAVCICLTFGILAAFRIDL